MYREKSKYANHPRVTWFGHGRVAYVDWTGNPLTSWYIFKLNHGGFAVMPPKDSGYPAEKAVASIDAGIAWALAGAPAVPSAN